MSVAERVNSYIQSQPESKREDLNVLHTTIQKLFTDCQLSFLDGKDESGRVVSNPNIGYGAQKLVYTDGTTKDFYQIGMSANTTGISIYIMGLKDKMYLSATYGSSIGKATVTGYCIRFKRLSDIRVEILEAAMKSGIEQTGTTSKKQG